jgi:hypothetical protein
VLVEVDQCSLVVVEQQVGHVATEVASDQDSLDREVLPVRGQALAACGSSEPSSLGSVRPNVSSMPSTTPEATASSTAEGSTSTPSTLTTPTSTTPTLHRSRIHDDHSGIHDDTAHDGSPDSEHHGPHPRGELRGGTERSVRARPRRRSRAVVGHPCATAGAANHDRRLPGSVRRRQRGIGTERDRPCGGRGRRLGDLR